MIPRTAFSPTPSWMHTLDSEGRQNHDSSNLLLEFRYTVERQDRLIPGVTVTSLVWAGTGCLVLPTNMGVTPTYPLRVVIGHAHVLKRDSTRNRKERDNMPKHQTRTDKSDANSALAYKFWLARCFRDGSPEEDLFRAVCANS